MRGNLTVCVEEVKQTFDLRFLPILRFKLDDASRGLLGIRISIAALITGLLFHRAVARQHILETRLVEQP